MRLMKTKKGEQTSIEDTFDFKSENPTMGIPSSSIDSILETDESFSNIIKSGKKVKEEKTHAKKYEFKDFAAKALRYATLGGVSYQTRLNLQDYFGKDKFSADAAYVVSTFTTGALMAYAGAEITTGYVETFGPLFHGPWSSAATGAAIGAAYNIAETIYALREKGPNPPLRTILHYPIEFFAKLYLDAHGYDKRIEGKFLENPVTVMKKAFSLPEKPHDGGVNT